MFRCFDAKYMNRRLLTIGLMLVALGIVIALVRGVAREALVVPLLAFIWQAAVLIEGLPQQIVWWGVILAMVVIIVRSLGEGAQFQLPERRAKVDGGRVSAWIRLVVYARHDDYSRWRMAQRLALLAQELIAQREGIDLRQARRVVEAGTGLPPEVGAYLRAGLLAHRPDTRLLGRLKRVVAHDPLTLDPAVVIAALEALS